MKTICTGRILSAFGTDTVKIEQRTRAPHKGAFVVRGAGFAGRVAHRELATAIASVERHARFAGWEA